MTNEKIALVTGANRGIGFEICRQLSRQKFKVILTARNEDKGLKAQHQLRNEGLPVDYQVLDVTNLKQIDLAAEYIKQRYGRLDILINNAGVIPDNDIPGHFNERSILDTASEKILLAFQTNALSIVDICRQFVPLLKKSKSGRIVNVSSLIAQLSTMDSGSPAYRISKVALNAITRILADELKEHKILCNAVSPGWVKTDMGGENATVSIEHGASEVIKIALLPDDGATGCFFRNGQPIDW